MKLHQHKPPPFSQCWKWRRVAVFTVAGYYYKARTTTHRQGLKSRAQMPKYLEAEADSLAVHQFALPLQQDMKKKVKFLMLSM